MRETSREGHCPQGSNPSLSSHVTSESDKEKDPGTALSAVPRHNPVTSRGAPGAPDPCVACGAAVPICVDFRCTRCCSYRNAEAHLYEWRDSSGAPCDPPAAGQP